MTDQILLTVPARLLTPGDQTHGFVVSQKHNFPDGSLEFRFVVPFTGHHMTVLIQEEHLDAISFPLVKRGDSYSPNARNAALGLPLPDATTFLAPPPIAWYGKGTRVGDVQHFDRGQKIAFHCPKHPKNRWHSKDPFVSSWFGTTSCPADCGTPTADMILDIDYKPTRNG